MMRYIGSRLSRTLLRIGVAATLSIPACANAGVTIDTVSFTLSGWTWTKFAFPQPHGTADGAALLSGTFVGTVETDALGTMKLSDISSFSLGFVDPSGLVKTIATGADRLAQFNFETLGGGSTLSFSQKLGPIYSVCLGFVAFLTDPSCSESSSLSPGTNAYIYFSSSLPELSTANQPITTIISSVTTGDPPPPPTVTSEPASLVILGTGFLGVLGIANGRRVHSRAHFSGK